MQAPILRRATTLIVAVVLLVTATWIVATKTGAETTPTVVVNSVSRPAADATLQEYFLPTHKWNEVGTTTSDLPTSGDSTFKEYLLPTLNWMGTRGPNGNTP